MHTLSKMYHLWPHARVVSKPYDKAALGWIQRGWIQHGWIQHGWIQRAALLLALLPAGLGCSSADETMPALPTALTVVTPDGTFANLTFYAPAACRPGAPAPGIFTEARETLGITFEHEPHVVDDEGELVMDFGGVAIGDLDGDLLLDLYFTNAGGADAVYLTGGAGPARWTAGAGSTDAPSNLAASLADLDGDGDLDVLIARDAAGWLENDGSGQLGPFHAMTPGTDAEEHTVFGFATGDLDGDGWLDVLTAVHEVILPNDEREWPGPEWLHRGSASGLVPATTTLPLRDVEDWTFLASLVDLDSDGDLDVYEFNDAFSLAVKGLSADDWTRQGNRILRNDAGVLVDQSDTSNAAIVRTAMGGAFGDYDNDGLTDIYVTTMHPETNALLHNLGGLSFEDVAFDLDADTLTDEHDVGWGAVFFDADADGWLDLFVAHGYLTDFDHDVGPANAASQADVLLRNTNGTGFVNVSEASGISGTGWSRSPSTGDLDRDGFPDLVVGNANGRPNVYLNGCDDRPHLTVRLAGRAPNTHAIGARVAVTIDGLSQTRDILGGGTGLYGSSAPEAYFGFPPGTEMATLTVQWPDGAVSTWPNVPLRHVVVATQP